MSGKAKKIMVILVVAIFVIFMGLSAVMYFIPNTPQVAEENTEADENTTVEIVNETPVIPEAGTGVATGEMEAIAE